MNQKIYNIHYRPINHDEHPFLKEMLYLALYVPNGQPPFPRSILESPDIKKYVDAWGKESGDLAIVGCHGNKLVGAIWGRVFPVDKKGYGFVDEHTPEFSMAVLNEYRSRGIGTALISELERGFNSQGVEKISLSVDKQNPARRLYEKCGYTVFEDQDTAITMLKEIRG